MQDVARERREERHGAAEEDGKQIERDGAQDDAAIANVVDALHDASEPRAFGSSFRHAASAERADENRRDEEGTAAHAVSGGRTEDIEEAAQGRARDHRRRECRRVERDRSRLPLRRDQKREERLAGRPGKPARGAEKHQDDIERRDIVWSYQREHEEQRRRGRLDQLRASQHAPLIEPIGHLAGGKREQEHRQELTEADEAKRERGVLDVVDLPADRDRLDLRGERREKPARYESREVARPILGRRWLRGRHRGYFAPDAPPLGHGGPDRIESTSRVLLPRRTMAWLVPRGTMPSHPGPTT